MNNIKTVFLLSLLTGILLGVGYLLGGQSGLIIALVFAVIMNFGSYFFSDKIVLATTRAKELPQSSAPEVYDIVRELTSYAKMPMPKIYYMNTDTLNAFATGRSPSNSVICLTKGIIQNLTRDELRGVIAHELAHVRNRDILISAVVSTIVGAITMLAYIAQWGMIFGGGDDDEGGGIIGALVLIIVTPIAATLLQLAISRNREYQADRTGALISRSPDSLANALVKLEQSSQKRRLPGATPANAHNFTVHPKIKMNFANLFSTHPSIKDRVNRLRSMSNRLSSR